MHFSTQLVNLFAIILQISSLVILVFTLPLNKQNKNMVN